MLANQTLVAMIATSRPEAARAFYEGVLGLRFLGDHPHALTFATDGGQLMVRKDDVVSPPVGTAVGWDVSDLPGAVRGLMARGVTFERFESMAQDALGIWSPGGANGVAWFKDPDGNLLSVSGPLQSV